MNPTTLSKVVKEINIPDHATAAVLSDDGNVLAVGFDDGSIRFYHPPEPRVHRAIRGLGESIADIALLLRDGSDCMVASGKRLIRFTFGSSPKLIYSSDDAAYVLDIGTDNDDAVNKLALSANGTYLACTTDSGGVHVVELATKTLMIMKKRHNSIAWNVAFIPDRPRELLSGGYDSSLLLFDFHLRTVLQRIEFTPEPPPAVGLSSTPPFVTALAISPRGTLAAGCADGRVWIGLGGEKSTCSGAATKKRNRKWEGLKDDEGFFTKVDGGMIAALQFTSANELLSVSVNGKLARHTIIRPQRVNGSSRSGNAESDLVPGGLRTVWFAQASSCVKVDVLAFAGTRFAIAGLHNDKKRGSIELWDVQSSELSESGNEEH